MYYQYFEFSGEEQPLCFLFTEITEVTTFSCDYEERELEVPLPKNLVEETPPGTFLQGGKHHKHHKHHHHHHHGHHHGHKTAHGLRKKQDKKTCAGLTAPRRAFAESAPAAALVLKMFRFSYGTSTS